MNDNTLTVGVRSVDAFFEEVENSVEKVGHTRAALFFPKTQDLFQTLGGKRWQLLEVLAGNDQMGVRELARRVSRDVRSVHRDTQMLVDGGVIEKNEKGKLSFPYSRIELEPLVFEGEKVI